MILYKYKINIRGDNMEELMEILGLTEDELYDLLLEEDMDWLLD